jgi:hypothetical protein
MKELVFDEINSVNGGGATATTRAELEACFPNVRFEPDTFIPPNSGGGVGPVSGPSILFV